jgi:mRNA interferase MazF
VAGLSAPLRWAVVVVDLDPVQGHEQAGERRALVVSYEPFHRSGLATVCPISAARTTARYPGDVPIPVGEAGQTRDAVIVVSQVRTVSLQRVRRAPVGTVTDGRIRGRVRQALAHHLGLDIPAIGDGARRTAAVDSR